MRLLVARIEAFGDSILLLLRSIGAAGWMLYGALVAWPSWRRSLPLLIKQIYVLGWQSLLIVSVSGLFIGMVLSLQGFVILIDFGAESALGQLVVLSLLRELGPVVTALLFAGRAGSALTAEIGLMKATEQLSSMEMMAVDPLKQVIAPRFWGGVLVMPILSMIFISVGVLGGQWVGVTWKGVDYGSFWSQIQASVVFSQDVVNSLIKALVFALAVVWVALFHGYHCKPTSEGISQATTRSVVHASLLILGLDFILTALMFGRS